MNAVPRNSVGACARWLGAALLACVAFGSTGCSVCLSHDTQYFFNGNETVSRRVCTASVCKEGYVKDRHGNCVRAKAHQRRVDKRAARDAPKAR